MSSDKKGDDDWRISVSQSERNKEVREIAKVLASLEPGATSSSKLMLAMRFEDSIFKAATSLADYKKKLTKRLKKVQKNYKPTSTQPAALSKEELIKDLRVKYGDGLLFIHEHAPVAITELRAKQGNEKATQLQKHTSLAGKWAGELGLLPNTKPKFDMSSDYLQRMKQHLETRLENIRSHVVKLADPDRFLQETLEKTEADLGATGAKLLASNTKKRFEQLHKEFDPVALLKESLEKAQTTVPPPTRTQRNEDKGALLHLEKMRAASTAIVAYLSVSDKATIPPNTMVKAYKVAMEGIKFVGGVMKERRKSIKEPEVTLEDAWNKIGRLALPDDSPGTSTSTSSAPTSANKRMKFSKSRLALRSKVLLTAGRKTPPNLIPQLKRKRATLVRPLPKGQGSHLILEFGKAFVMIIYFEPLLVTIRAMTGSQDSENNDNGNKSLSLSSRMASTPWMPLHQGLTNGQELKVWGVKGTYEAIGHVLQERLRDASAHATQVLRKSFAANAKENAADFEVEMLEGSALLKFLDNARKTYIPDWQDATV